MLQRPLDQPAEELAQVARQRPAVAEMGVNPLQVVGPRLLPFRVAGEGLGCETELLRDVPEGVLGAAREVVGTEAEVPDGAQGEGETQAIGGRAFDWHRGPVATREGEVDVEVLGGDLLREPGQAPPLGVRQQAYRYLRPPPSAASTRVKVPPTFARSQSAKGKAVKQGRVGLGRPREPRRKRPTATIPCQKTGVRMPARKAAPQAASVSPQARCQKTSGFC